jgi:hypothetical protein
MDLRGLKTKVLVRCLPSAVLGTLSLFLPTHILGFVVPPMFGLAGG